MMQHQTENDNCFVCNEPTLGVFNTAVEIKERIDEEREKARGLLKRQILCFDTKKYLLLQNAR